MKTLTQAVFGCLLLAAAVPTFATPPVNVPEPMGLSFLALGVGATIVVRALRKRG